MKFKWLNCAVFAVGLIGAIGVWGTTSAAFADALGQPKSPNWTLSGRAGVHAWRPPSTLIARSQDQEQARDGVRAGQIVPLSMVLQTIRQRYPNGKLLNARTVGGQRGIPLRYEVRWLTPDSHRLDIIADASTGKIISVRGQ